MMKKYIYVFLGFISLIIIVGVINMNMNKPGLLEKTPQKINQWAISEKDGTLDKIGLYKYINGGAELYLSYGYKIGYSRTFSAPDQPDIILDMFDMGTSENAFGVFAHSRETIERQFGQGSQYTSGLLQFWKDKYYISILSSPETDASKKAVFELAAKIDGFIDKEGKQPVILKLLPADSLVQESVRYFHHYIWLNTYFFISNENILNIDSNTDAVLAKYGELNKRQILLIIKYKNAKLAKSAEESFKANYQGDELKQSIVELKPGKWMGFEVLENYFIAVFEAQSKAKVENYLDSVKQNIVSLK